MNLPIGFIELTAFAKAFPEAIVFKTTAPGTFELKCISSGNYTSAIWRFSVPTCAEQIVQLEIVS